jgi:hypothetical protein
LGLALLTLLGSLWLALAYGSEVGVMHGLTLWGALLILTLTIGIPSLLNMFSLGQITSETTNGLLMGGNADTALWSGFWTILGGFVAAGVGGAIGGAMSRGVRTRTRTRTFVADDTYHYPRYDHDAEHARTTASERFGWHGVGSTASADDDDERGVDPSSRPVGVG